MKHIKDQGTIVLTNVLGDAVDDRGQTAAEHAAWILELELKGAPQKVLRQVSEWKPRSFSFADFVRMRLLDPRFSKDMAGMLVAVEIQAAVREMQKTGWLSLVTDHYDQLRTATEKPDEKLQYQPSVAHNFVDWAVAIVRGAVDELPPAEVRSGVPNGADVAAHEVAA